MLMHCTVKAYDIVVCSDRIATVAITGMYTHYPHVRPVNCAKRDVGKLANRNP